MPRIVLLHRLAAKEANAALRWYASRSAGAGDGFKQAFDAAIDWLAEGRVTHRFDESHYRYLALRRYPFRLVLEEIDINTVFVIAVAHYSRRPGYWRRRK